MKKLFQIIFFAALGTTLKGQTFNYQLYHDLNGNCAYDVGEPLVYNPPANVMLYYLNTGNNVATSSHSTFCGGTGIPLINAASPATNTFVVSAHSYYPGFVPSLTCAVWQNNGYSSTNYFPLSSANPVSEVVISTSLEVDTVIGSNQQVLTCGAPGDTVRVTFSVKNLYSCSTAVSPRTYSLFLDGVFFEQFNTSGMPWTWSFNQGVNSFGRIEEGYGTYDAYINIHTTLPNGISGLGTHTLTLKTTPLYSNSLSAVDESWLLNSVPCTNVSGNVFIDCNSNCVKDAGDHSPGSAAQGALTNGSFSTYFSPASNGLFSLFVPSTGNYTMTISSHTLLTPCSPTSVVFSGSAPNNTLSFGFTSSALMDPNVAVGRITPGSTDPGDTLLFRVCTGSLFSWACNGPISNSGPVKVVLPPFMTYIGGSTPSPTVIPAGSGDTLVWHVPSFTSIICHNFSITISSTISTQTSFTIGAHIYPGTDVNPGNNSNYHKGKIGAPYDPNNKLSWSQNMAQNGDFPVNETLHYTINFQNIGTSPAVNVMIIDTLDSNLDLASLRITGSSYPVQLQADQNTRQLTFRFNNINLAPASLDEAGSQGYVQYEVKLNSGVPFNTVIRNRAHNYFDYTDPVATNQTSNMLIDVTTAIRNADAQAHVALLPNPTSGKLTIVASQKIMHVKVMNQLGQISGINVATGSANEMDLSSHPAGIYFVSVTLDNGQQVVRRVIKE